MNITTYKQAYETADAMRRSGCSEAVVASRRAELIAQVERRYKRTKDLRRSVRVDHKRLGALLDDVLSVYRVESAQVFRRYHSKPVIASARRAFVCAARKAGFSLCEIAAYLRRPGSHSSIHEMERTATAEEKAIGNAAWQISQASHSIERAHEHATAQTASAA